MRPTFLKDDPKRAAPHVSAAFGKGLVADDILLEAIKSPQTQFTSDPRRIIDSTAKLQDYQVKLGALEKADPLDGLFALPVSMIAPSRTTDGCLSLMPSARLK